MVTTRLALIAWTVLLAAAIALSVAAAGAGPLAGDRAITDAVQDAPDIRALVDSSRAVTDTLAVLLIGAVAVVFFWFAGARREALTLAVLLALLPFAQAGLKDLVDRPRPDPALVDRRTGFSSESFPAGHIMSGTVLYGYLALIAWRLPGPAGFRRGIAVCLALLLAFDAFANVSLGVHWPSDVLGGFLWAAVLLVPAGLSLVHSWPRFGC